MDLLFLFYNFKNLIELKNKFTILKEKKNKWGTNDKKIKILCIKIKILKKTKNKKFKILHVKQSFKILENAITPNLSLDLPLLRGNPFATR